MIHKGWMLRGSGIIEKNGSYLVATLQKTFFLDLKKPILSREKFIADDDPECDVLAVNCDLYKVVNHGGWFSDEEHVKTYVKKRTLIRTKKFLEAWKELKEY